MEQPSSVTLTVAAWLPVFRMMRRARLSENSLKETSVSVTLRAVALAADARPSSQEPPLASFSGTSPSHATVAPEPAREARGAVVMCSVQCAVCSVQCAAWCHSVQRGARRLGAGGGNGGGQAGSGACFGCRTLTRDRHRAALLRPDGLGAHKAEREQCDLPRQSAAHCEVWTA